MKRVLYMVAADEVAGAERVLADLVSAMPRDRVLPIVAAPHGPVADLMTEAGAEVLPMPGVPRLRNLPRAVGTLRALTDLIDRAAPDVVQPNGEKLAVLGGRAAHRSRVPSVFWLHDAPGSGISGVVQRAMARTPHAAAVACSRWMADAFRDRYGMEPRAILNGVAVRDPLHRTGARDEFGWADDHIVVAFVGRLQRWKGPDVFIRAASLAAARDPRLRFLVVGGALYGRDEGFAASLPGMASALGLGERLIFTGHRDDVHDLISSSDVIVQASVTPEPGTIVVAESMMLGRPVIATGIGASSEMIEDGRTGVLVAPGDPTILGQAMIALASDPGVRDRIGRAAASSARERLAVDRVAAAFADLYEEVAS